MGRQCCIYKCAATKVLIPSPHNESTARLTRGLQWSANKRQKYVCKEIFLPESFLNMEMVNSPLLLLKKDAAPVCVDCPVSTNLSSDRRITRGLPTKQQVSNMNTLGGRIAELVQMYPHLCDHAQKYFETLRVSHTILEAPPQIFSVYGK